MNIHEYQAKDILRAHGVPIPPGEVATTPDEVEAIAKKIGGMVVVKAQVHTGGRGKAGGVKLAKSPSEAKEIASKILGMKINGLTVNERQRLMLNRMSEDNTPVTSSVWARNTDSSQDSAGRDINDLLMRKILVKEIGGGRSTSYSMNKKLFA